MLDKHGVLADEKWKFDTGVASGYPWTTLVDSLANWMTLRRELQRGGRDGDVWTCGDDHLVAMPTIVNEEKWFDNYYKNIEERWWHKAKYYHFAGIRDGFVVGDGVEIMGFFIRGRRIVREAVRLAATMTMPSKGAWDQLGVIVKSRASTGVAPMDGSAAKKLKVWEQDLNHVTTASLLGDSYSTLR